MMDMEMMRMEIKLGKMKNECILQHCEDCSFQKDCKNLEVQLQDVEITKLPGYWDKDDIKKIAEVLI